MELRNRFRYRLSADAMFAWEGPEEGLFLGEGLIRDISLSGAFILSLACPPVGAQVQLDVCLDPKPLFGRQKIRILSDATVVRVEQSSKCEGFATTTDDLTLVFNAGARNEFCVSGGSKAQQGHIDERQDEVHYRRMLHAILRRNSFSGSG